MKRINFLTLLIGALFVFSTLDAKNQKQEQVGIDVEPIKSSSVMPEKINSNFFNFDEKNKTGGKSGYLIDEDFSSGDIPASWLNIDEDGDGHYWETHHFGGVEYSAVSYSRDLDADPQEPLTPDNWLITEQLSIDSDSYELSFWRAAANMSFYEENYSVYISTTGTNISDFTDQIYTEELDNYEWQERVIPLDSYEGEDIYIAFRHHDCTNLVGLLLDFIQVYDLGKLPTPVYDPSPANEEIDVPLDANLEWTWGANTEEFVLLIREDGETEWQAGRDAALQDEGERASYILAGIMDLLDDIELKYNTTYEWGIVSLNEFEDEAGTPIWTFTTAEEGDPPAETFTVTFGVENGTGGTITATANGDPITSPAEVEEGAEVIFTANPAGGYEIVNWHIDGSATGDTDSEYTISSLDDDVEVMVEFDEILDPDTYTVTFSVQDGNGIITATADGDNIDSGDDILEGSQIIFTAEPVLPGNRVLDWYLNDTPVGSTALTYTINSVDDDVDVKVEFEEIPEYEVTYDVLDNGGTISATDDGSSINSGDMVYEGSEVIFTAAPDAGYQVADWHIDGTATGSTDLTYTVNNLTANIEAIVEFEEIPETTTYEVVFGVLNEVGGDIGATLGDFTPISSGDLIDEGSTIHFGANPHAGYQIADWHVDGTAIGSTAATYTINSLDDDVVVIVEFEEIQTTTYEVVFGVLEDGGSITATADGTSITSPATVEEGAEVIFTATPEDGYQVADWHVDETAIGSTDETYTISSLDGNVEVMVEFEEETSVANHYESNLVVYPNPANAVLNIENDEIINNIKLIDVKGRIVYSNNINSKQIKINVSEFNNGLYILQISTNDNVDNVKIKIVR